MNSINLINPLTSSQYKEWQRWIRSSCIIMCSTIAILLLLTCREYKQLYALKKKLMRLQKTVDADLMHYNKQLHATYQAWEQKYASLQSWSKHSACANILKIIAEKIPNTIALTTLSCFGSEEITCSGLSKSIESLLDFLQNIEQSNLFQSMNIVKLDSYNYNNKKKPLVNFLVQGKLKNI